MRHRLGRGVTGVVAGLAAICLLSLPAAANTATLTFVNVTGTTPGTITLLNADDDPAFNLPLPGPAGVSCSTGTTAVSTTLTGGGSSGDISLTFTSNCSAFTLGTNQFCAFMSGSFTGTWLSNGSYTSTTGTTAITVLLRKNTGTTHNCHTVTTTFCTVSVDGITLGGTITSANALPTLADSDTATVTGSSGNGTLLVSGNATTCGLFIGANNGSVAINAKVHADV
jgi:hypothetical protein